MMGDQLGKALLLIALVAATLPGAYAEDGSEDAKQEIPPPTEFVTTHKAEFAGESIEYEARAGETYLHDTEGDPRGSIFSFDYVALNDGAQRPVTFVWNGGPGSASLWLHMGAFGPKRVVVPSDAEHPGPPPYPTLAAPETILDVTDLVFVDPVGTGFSRALGDHEGKEFWGLYEDANSIAEFIETWLRENNRWNSPKFFLGESFGTTRAAAVANLLQSDHDIAVNGLIFISQALDYAGSTPYVSDNLISYVTYLPTMAATAWHHNRVDRNGESLEGFLADARAFAMDELMPALFRGNSLDRESRNRVRDGLARFTGLSPDYIERANLRVDGRRFAAELLRDEGAVVGALDSRYKTAAVDQLATAPRLDASSAAISSAYKMTLLEYIQSELNVDWDRPYLAPSDPDLGEQWNWNPRGRDANWEPYWVNTARDLSQAMEANPVMTLFVASGYHDLVTPFFDAEFTLQRHGIPGDRTDFRFYQGGHMMYVHEPSRVALLEDVRAFIERSLR